MIFFSIFEGIILGMGSADDKTDLSMVHHNTLCAIYNNFNVLMAKNAKLHEVEISKFHGFDI